MNVGELTAVLNEFALCEDYDPNAAVYLMTGEDDRKFGLTEAETDDGSVDMILVGWYPR